MQSMNRLKTTKLGRFRVVSLIIVLGMAAAIYSVVRTDRLDSDLREAVVDRDTARVGAALKGGADPNGKISVPGEGGLFKIFDHGLNPFASLMGRLSGTPRRPGRKSNEPTFLIYAAKYGDTPIAEDLISHGARIEATQENGDTALFLCIGHSAIPCLDLLLQHGASVQARNADGQTPLHVAAAADAVEALERFLDHGGDMTATDRSGLTPLAVAVRAHAPRACLLLLDRGASPAEFHRSGSAGRGGDSASRPANVHEAPGAPSLGWASASGSLPLVRKLFESVLTPEERRSQTPDALYRAVYARDYSITTYLLDHAGRWGAHPTRTAARQLPIVDEVAAAKAEQVGAHSGAVMPLPGAAPQNLSASQQGLHPLADILSIAAGYHDVKMCKLILSHGGEKASPADLGSALTSALAVEAKRPNKITQPAEEVGTDPYELTHYLLTLGADVRSADQYGRQPLIAAASDPDLIRMLLSRGADVNAKDNEGQSALMAASGVSSRSVEALLSAGAKVNEGDRMGTTPLMYAIRSHPPAEMLRTARLLLARGADVSVRNRQGFTAAALLPAYRTASAALVPNAQTQQWNATANLLATGAARHAR